MGIGTSVNKSGSPANNLRQVIFQKAAMQFIPISVLFLSIAGCQGDPNVDFYTTKKPATADVAGRYTLTSQTIEPGGLAVLKDKECRVELLDDGTFTATNVPSSGDERQEEEFLDRLVSSSGKWKIDSVGSIANSGRKPKTHWGVILETEKPEIMAMGLTGKTPPYGLLITVGDPDSGRVMFFEKAE